MIRVGTRGSALALAQAGEVAAGLRARGVEVTVVPIRTEGDRLAEARLDLVGGKGLFVREIEEALLRGTIDVAVHSLKDLPAALPPGLCLAVFPPREAAHDVLVTRDGGELGSLPAGAVLGTSSPRRRAIALGIRPDLLVTPLRGNVDTRLRKLAAGDCDALVLAAAGLRRLAAVPAAARPLPLEVFVPAVGQGVLGVETRVDDRRTRELLAPLDDAATRVCALAERAYLAALGGSCTTPLAAHARIVATDGAGAVGDIAARRGGAASVSAHLRFEPGSRSSLHITALVASEDGRRVLRASDTAAMDDGEALGRRLAETLLARGAADVAALHPGGR